MHVCKKESLLSYKQTCILACVIISTTNQKGGVGKTTIAVHCAAWLVENGVRVAVVDADVQSSSTEWLREAYPEIPVKRLQTADDVLEGIPQLQRDHEVVVVDGPAGLTEVTRAILLITDGALLPCGPSVLDLRAADEAVRVLRQAQGIRKGSPWAFFVPNRLQRHLRLSRELLETAQTLGIPVAPGLGLRQAFADAPGQGTTVWKMGSAANEAGDELNQLFTKVFSHDQAKTTNGTSD